MYRWNPPKTLMFVAALALISYMAYAVEEPDRETPGLVTIPNTATHLMKAKQIDSVFRIDVALPYRYEQSNQSYPVIYLTDGDFFFAMVTGNMRSLQLTSEIPQAILVGIGYKVEDPLSAMSLRSRDLTPTFEKTWAESGGAERFIAFINEEVKPFIDSQYRTDPDDQTLVGYSLGGLFAFYVLTNHTDSFSKYIIGSPSFWWDQGISFRYEDAFSKNHKDLPKTVFMSSGSLEEAAENPGPQLMVTNMKTMVDRLAGRNYPSLNIDRYIFDGETHQSAIGTSINRGLRFVFRKNMETEGTKYKYDGKPSFTIEFPEGTNKAPLTDPNQVFAATTADGVLFDASVADIDPGMAIDKSAQLYVANLESVGVGSEFKITSNVEITLKDGTKAYRSEIRWFFIPSRVRLMTQMVSAQKDGKLVRVSAHPLSDPERVIPIIESLRFK